MIVVDPNAAQTPTACILDSADLKPVTAVAPDQLLSCSASSPSGGPVIATAGQLPTSLGGVSIEVNGIPSPRCSTRWRAANPTSRCPGGSRRGRTRIAFASALSNLSGFAGAAGSRNQPGGVSQYGDTTSAALGDCTTRDSATVNGSLPLALPRGWLGQHVFEDRADAGSCARFRCC